MGQDALVTDEIEGGRQLVDRLKAEGFEVSLAFWVKETNAGRWYLYLASPLVDDQGPGAGYRVVSGVVQSVPETGILPDMIKLVGNDYSMTSAAWQVVNSKYPADLSAGPNAKRYTGMIRFDGSTLNGIDVDAAFIYSPYRQPSSAGAGDAAR